MCLLLEIRKRDVAQVFRGQTANGTVFKFGAAAAAEIFSKKYSREGLRELKKLIKRVR
jgi:hypothetical protein